MTMSKELEDSLQVCQTIQNELQKKTPLKEQVHNIMSQYDTTEFILEPAEAPAAQPLTELELEPAEAPAAQPLTELELELEPAEAPAAQPLTELELEPAEAPAAEPLTELELEPAEAPAAQPLTELELEPAEVPAAEPFTGLELEPAENPLDAPAFPTEKAAKKGKKKSEKGKEQTRKKEKKIVSHPALRTVLSILICLFTALIFALLITEFVAHHTSVTGSSMEMTLTDGDEIIVENISYYLHDPERFDIIVFSSDQGINYIKRIIGMPGETVQILDGYLYVNGQQMDESYGKEVMSEAGLAAQEIVLGPDEYFVLGDNRNGSVDSRKEEVGNVRREQIKGKAWLRFYPFSHFGSVE